MEQTNHMNGLKDIHVKIAHNALADNQFSKALVHLVLATNSEENDYEALQLLAHTRIMLGHEKIKRNKIGFLATCQMHIDQYYNIWKHLPTDSFEIILHNDRSLPPERHYLPTRNYLAERNLPVVELADCFRNLMTYRVIMTAGFVQAVFPEVEYAFSLAAQYIRVLSQGFQEFHFGFVNKFTHLFLQGYNQVEQVRDIGFKGEIYVIGYPRFDNYFELTSTDTEQSLTTLLNLDRAKKTILYTPTHSLHTSLWYYCEDMISLTAHYNVIIKPHLASFSDEKEAGVIQRVKKGGVHVISSSLENSLLYKAADYVLADYGGSVLSAIYLAKKTILLNSSADLHAMLPCPSSEMVRQLTPNIYPSDNSYHELLAALRSTNWDDYATKIAVLKRYFFAPFDGISGKTASIVLLNLLERS